MKKTETAIRKAIVQLRRPIAFLLQNYGRQSKSVTYVLNQECYLCIDCAARPFTFYLLPTSVRL